MDDQQITSDLESWFDHNARDLPWRLNERDPYHALVSELMLQQTQVSRVLEKYEPFITQFPTVQSLADAPEDEVLAAWAGLGYYRRARMLHACAKAIVESHDGQVPKDIETLQTLPGIGRYTAGAIASMVFGQREPIVDGNVTRVLLRLHNKPEPQTDKDTVKWAWARADELVKSAARPAVFNEAMMELGATCCTPKNIRCAQCPWQRQCQAFANGTTESIPLPKPKAKQKPLYCATIVATKNNSILLEQRPDTGMWASMYQAPTLEHAEAAIEPSEIAERFKIESDGLEVLGTFKHITTHRVIEFVVYQAAGFKVSDGRKYHKLDALDQIALSNAQRKALTMAGLIGEK